MKLVTHLSYNENPKDLPPYAGYLLQVVLHLDHISAKLTIAAALTISQWLGSEKLICHGQRYFNCL